jgi:hypothetical protein
MWELVIIVKCQVISCFLYHGDKLFLMRWYIMVTSDFWWDDISWWQVISDEMIYHGDKLFLMRWYIMVTSNFWWDDISWWQVISDEMIYHGDK